MRARPLGSATVRSGRRAVAEGPCRAGDRAPASPPTDWLPSSVTSTPGLDGLGETGRGRRAGRRSRPSSRVDRRREAAGRSGVPPPPATLHAPSHRRRPAAGRAAGTARERRESAGEPHRRPIGRDARRGGAPDAATGRTSRRRRTLNDLRARSRRSIAVRAPMPSGDRRARCAAALRHDQSGFGLIEVVVSSMLLVLVASGVYLGLDGASATSGVNKHRSVASEIAQQDQDRMRAMAVNELSNYRATNDHESRPASPTRSPRARAGSPTAPAPASCTSGQAQAHYLRISSSVTWPNMTIQPVTVESVVAPPAGSFGTNHGSLAVQVRDRNGNGVPGVSVALSGPQTYTDTTNADRLRAVGLPAGRQLHGHRLASGLRRPQRRRAAVEGGRRRRRGDLDGRVRLRPRRPDPERATDARQKRAETRSPANGTRVHRRHLAPARCRCRRSATASRTPPTRRASCSRSPTPTAPTPARAPAPTRRSTARAPSSRRCSPAPRRR